jgi:subfamily B ATP-binding cassette protein MsbA
VEFNTRAAVLVSDAVPLQVLDPQHSENRNAAPFYRRLVEYGARLPCARHGFDSATAARCRPLMAVSAPQEGNYFAQGSGKIVAHLLNFWIPEEGSLSIEIDGIDLRDLSVASLRGLIGVVSQESILFNMTAAQNIAFGDDNPDLDKIIAAAKVANAHEFILELDNGYQTVLGERGNKLSGGQKQRIAIARAVYKNPAILILDEATSALDTASETLVQQALENLMHKRTSFVIAHRLSTVKNADEIIVLSKGQIVEQGNHETLLAQESFYKKLCALQGLA